MLRKTVRRSGDYGGARVRAFASLVTLCAIGIMTACGGDNDDPEPSASTTSVGGGDGTGGMGASGPGGSSGTAGGGGAAGGGVPCLPASEHTSDFTIEDPALCVVAKYTSDLSFGNYQWGGRHGGPMRLDAIDDVEDPSPDPFSGLSDAQLTRLTPPQGVATGALTATTETFNLDLELKSNAQRLHPQVLDVPDTDGTILAYSNTTALDTSGEVLVFDGTNQVAAFSMSRFESGTFLEQGSQPRLLYTGRTILGDDVSLQTGLYQAEFCANFTLCPTPTPSLVEAWGAPSPGLNLSAISIDANGNLFAFQRADNNADELRGYAFGDVAPGASTPDSGVVFTSAGRFAPGALAALGPKGDDDGWIFTQALNADNTGGDVAAYRYDDAGGTITARGSNAAVVLTLVGDPKLLARLLFNDDQDRVWLGVFGASGAAFYVLGRATP